MPRQWAREALDDGAWFHGSPERLEVLRAGSTITRSRPVAEAFSHKPFCLSVDESQRPLEICHNGTLPGYLYVVEEVTEADLHPHPDSAFPGGDLEWLTDRPLRLRLVAGVPIGNRPDCQHCPRRPPR